MVFFINYFCNKSLLSQRSTASAYKWDDLWVQFPIGEGGLFHPFSSFWLPGKRGVELCRLTHIVLLVKNGEMKCLIHMSLTVPTVFLVLLPTQLGAGWSVQLIKLCFHFIRCFTFCIGKLYNIKINNFKLYNIKINNFKLFPDKSRQREPIVKINHFHVPNFDILRVETQHSKLPFYTSLMVNKPTNCVYS